MRFRISPRATVCSCHSGDQRLRQAAILPSRTHLKSTRTPHQAGGRVMRKTRAGQTTPSLLGTHSKYRSPPHTSKFRNVLIVTIKVVGLAMASHVAHVSCSPSRAFTQMVAGHVQEHVCSGGRASCRSERSADMKTGKHRCIFMLSLDDLIRHHMCSIVRAQCVVRRAQAGCRGVLRRHFRPSVAS